MAKSTLKTDFKDDILSPNMGGKRKYRMIQNEDGTVSLEDVTEYTQIGSNFGSKQVNETNLAVNNSVDKADVIENIEDIAANVTQGKVAGALAVRELNSKSYEIIKSSNGYVKKYANGRFEAYIRITIQNDFGFTQIGNSGIYYAIFSNAAIGITAVEVTSIITNAANNGVIWSGNAYLNSNNQAVNGMVFQYGADKTRTTTIMAEVKGRWK